MTQLIGSASKELYFLSDIISLIKLLNLLINWVVEPDNPQFQKKLQKYSSGQLLHSDT